MKFFHIFLSTLLLGSVGSNLFSRVQSKIKVGERQYNACLSKKEGASCSFEFDKKVCPDCPSGKRKGTCHARPGNHTILQTGKKVTDPLVCDQKT